MLKKTLIAATLIAGTFAGLTIASSTNVVDEPLVCPYCGGGFTPQGLGVEVMRETGVRAALGSIGLSPRF